MANKTQVLYTTKANYLDERNPYTTYKANTTTEYDVSRSTYADSKYKEMVFGIQAMPSNLKHNVLIGFTFTIAIRSTSSTGERFYVSTLTSDFNENTVNYNNCPSENTLVSIGLDPNAPFANRSSNYVQSGDSTSRIFTSNAIKVSAQFATDPIYTKTVLTNGSTKPYFTITYDDTVKVKGKISYSNSQLSGSVNPGVAKTVSWSIIRDTTTTGYCAVLSWTQTSARFYWRVQGTSTWNTISVSGSTTSVTIPANTFKSGSTIEYYISETDEDGTTSNTSTYTFTTLATTVTPVNSPTSGYVNPRTDRQFSWSYNNSSGTIPAGATTLHWRVSGAETWNDVSAASGVTSLTIPADTFPLTSTIQWYLSGADITGYTSQSSVYSFTTSAANVVTDPISPVNSIESNNSPITFNWRYSSSDGFPPSLLRLMWQPATGGEWTTIVDLTNAETTYTISANELPAGEIRWGVHPYNIDNVSGTGHTATFICYGAPEAPVVYADNVPYSTVTWQASDQQAYQIMVDDTLYGPYFGTEKSFELPDYLEDGEHTVKVSVVGTYALWSEWGQTAVSIQNVPGEDVTIDADAMTDVELLIDTEESNPTFLVYRDGILIAKTNQSRFTDRFALGYHTYKVISKLQDGNYTVSNEINKFTCVKNANIALLSGGDWLELKYTLKDQNDPEYEDSVSTSYNHLSGSEFPFAAISEYRDLTVTYSAVFLYTQPCELKTFESMFKKPVVIKFKDGTVFVGVLNSWTKRAVKRYYMAYTFTVTQIDFEDYIDDTE